MTFLLWFSRAEQALRYSAVKANAFAFTPEVPEHLLHGRHAYQAYLIENLLPGSPGSPTRPEAARAPSLDGRRGERVLLPLGGQPDASGRYLDDEFYRRFGTARTEVIPEENVYLKIFHTLYTRKPHDLAAFIRAYVEIFPEETAAVDSVARRAGERPIGPGRRSGWPTRTGLSGRACSTSFGGCREDRAST